MAASDWLPTPPEVKSQIPTRLSGKSFSDTTRPSLADVVSTIAGVQSEVLGAVGSVPEDDDIERMARWAVVLGAAYRIERGWFPEQQDQSGTAAALREDFQSQLTRLQRAITAHGTDESRATTGTTKTPSAVVAEFDRYDPVSLGCGSWDSWAI